MLARNPVLEHVLASADVTDRGLICAPVDGAGRSQLDELRMRSWAEIHQMGRTLAGGLQAAGVAPGDAVAVLAGSPVEVAPLVQGIWMSGASVTMVHHPTGRSDLAAWVADTAEILSSIGASTLVVGCPFDAAFEQFRAATGLLCLRLDELATATAGRVVTLDESRMAFLQLTSGSTGRPRAVTISYRNIDANMRAMQIASETDAGRDLTVSWLPLFHDMGMMGFLIYPTYHAMNAVVVTPPDFLSDPLLWPTLIDRYRGTMTAAPNFAYDVVARRLQQAAPGSLDLSCLRFALTGGEWIDPATLNRFLAAGARFGVRKDVIVPAYGMAEATLAISFTRPGELYRMVSAEPGAATADRIALGRPLPGGGVRVVGPDGTALPAETVGELQIRGANISAGYRTRDGIEPITDAAGWMASGDLGYLTEDGQPVICGRSKDALIISGRTVIPEDIERCVAGAVTGVRPGGVVAVRIPSSPDREGFAVVVESPDYDDPAEADRISAEVGRRIFDELGLSPRTVHVVAPGWVPKTSSGKLRRGETAQRLMQTAPTDGAAAPAGRGGPPQGIMECWVADVWQLLLQIERPGRRDRFTDLGGDSLTAVEFCRLLNEKYGVSMSVDRFATRLTIAELVADLQPGTGQQCESIVRLRTDGHGPVYLMIPGFGLHAWAFTGLAQAVEGPCDMLALSLTEICSGPARDTRGAIRSAALTVLRETAGRPVAVAGYSFGALIAVDLVGWLADHDVPVERLLLIDPSPIEIRGPWLSPRSYLSDGLYAASPRTHRAMRKLLGRDHGSIGPAAVRKIEDDVDAVHYKLRKAYFYRATRLPQTPMSWLQTREAATKYAGATTIFGTPISSVDREVVEAAHIGLLTGSSLSVLFDWWRRHASVSPAGTVPTGLAAYLRRDGLQPTPELTRIRDTGRVDAFTTAFGATAYLATRHRDVKAVLRDHARFANRPPWAGARAPLVDESTHPITVDMTTRVGNLLSLDPPAHTRLRHMLAPEFTVHRMDLLKPRIAEIVEDHLSALKCAGSPADLVTSFALPIPSLVICELLGVPYADREEFQRRTARQLDVSTPLNEQLALDLESRACMAELIGRSRRQPVDTLLGRLIRSHGHELTDEELTGIASLLLSAGHETTANMLALGTLALLMHPEQLAVVRDDPDATVPAIEELLRWLSIVTSPWARFTTNDFEVNGVRIPAGRPVMTSLLAANRDPDVFDDPDRLDVRRMPGRHVAFGYGVHYCLGAPMARMEMAIALPALLRRFPGLALDAPFEELAFRSSHFIFGVSSLPVKW